MTIITGPSLSDEMRAVEAEFPGWHLFTSNTGRIWACTCKNCYGGSGSTLDAQTPQEMRRVIAREIREWAQVAA